MAQKVNTKIVTGAVTQSPIARFMNEAGVIVAAGAAAQPVLIAGLGLTATTAGKITSVLAGISAVLAGAKSVAEHFGWIPVPGGQAVSATSVTPREQPIVA